VKDRKAKQILSGDRYHWEVGEPKKRVKEGKYGGCISYSCMKIEE
jgi:hypothetical protein